MADETTARQAPIEGEAASNNEQALEASPQGELDNGIPEKFVGKSSVEIIEAYKSLEKHLGKISSERSAERKDREERDSYYKKLESDVQDLKARISQPQQRQEMESEEEDPISEYEKDFDQDPKQAIKKALSAVNRQADKKATKVAMERDLQVAREYHTQQMKENPEYQKLFPKMQALANEFNDLVRPDKANNARTLKLLHLAAQGAERDAYVSEAVSRAKKEGTTIREEKRQAFSETSQGTGTGKTKDPKDMTMEELEKLIGRAD